MNENIRLADLDVEPGAAFIALGGPLTGPELLDQLHARLVKFVVFPTPEAAHATTLWIAATHAQDAWQHATRLHIKSPMKRCGKSRLLDIVAETCRNPLITANATPAALFRKIGPKDPPTILIDEIDAVFGKAKEAEKHEDLRALLNAGYQRNRPAIRCVPPTNTVQEFPTFAMAALAGIGDLPDTIEDRSVIIRLRRKTAGERVSKFRLRRDVQPLHDLRDQLHAWAESEHNRLAAAEPVMDLDDREADTWEPLIAIADAAGGDWPQRGRKAAAALIKEAEGSDEDVLMSVRLLADLRVIFGEHHSLHTETILNRLHKVEESPWPDYFGNPLNARDMASLLGQYDIKSRDVKIEGMTRKGYQRADLWDAWQRYVPQPKTGDRRDDADPGTVQATLPLPGLPPLLSPSTSGNEVAPENEVALPGATGSGGSATPETRATYLSSQVAQVAEVAEGWPETGPDNDVPLPETPPDNFDDWPDDSHGADANPPQRQQPRRSTRDQRRRKGH